MGCQKALAIGRHAGVSGGGIECRVAAHSIKAADGAGWGEEIPPIRSEETPLISAVGAHATVKAVHIETEALHGTAWARDACARHVPRTACSCESSAVSQR